MKLNLELLEGRDCCSTLHVAGVTLDLTWVEKLAPAAAVSSPAAQEYVMGVERIAADVALFTATHTAAVSVPALVAPNAVAPVLDASIATFLAHERHDFFPLT